MRICPSIPWKTLNASDLEIYKLERDIHLSKLKLDHSLLLRDNITCKDPSHLTAMDTIYNAVLLLRH